MINSNISSLIRQNQFPFVSSYDYYTHIINPQELLNRIHAGDRSFIDELRHTEGNGRFDIESIGSQEMEELIRKSDEQFPTPPLPQYCPAQTK